MISGSTAFTVALVPTAMNAGVLMWPCGVLRTPVRPCLPGSRVPTVKPARCRHGSVGGSHPFIQPRRAVPPTTRPAAQSARPAGPAIRPPR